MALSGETVLWMPLIKHPDGRVRQLEPKCQVGIWLGIDPRNDEILIATEKGIEGAQCAKRRQHDGSFGADRQAPSNPGYSIGPRPGTGDHG